MELFAEKQLEAHHINQDLAILYQEFMDKEEGRFDGALALCLVQT